MKNIYKIGKELYITSNKKIKEGDWCLDLEEYSEQRENTEDIFVYRSVDEDHWDNKKIILTTDVNLIKDGVQLIPDDFLEWFVKNPSYEDVGITFGCLEVRQCMCESNARCLKPGYEIIIPKEERKKNFYCGDEVDYDDKCLEQCDGCNDATGVHYGYLTKEEPKQSIKDKILSETSEEVKQRVRDTANKLVMKQETLEEVAERMSTRIVEMIFEGDTKWQQERSYSEEDLKEAFGMNDKDWICFEEWFEQFKKK